MNIKSINIDFSYTDENIAKAIFDIFFYQYSEALSAEISNRHNLSASEAANKSYEEEWKKQDGLGWCSNHPFSNSDIEYKKSEVKKSEKNLKDAKALMLFVRDRFLEKFNIQQKT